MILSVCPNPSIDILAEIDHFAPGKVNRILKQHEYPGGKGVHVALAVSEIYGNSDLLAFWGGTSGNWVREECGKRNIKCFGPEVSGKTRSCYTLNWENNERYKDTELLGLGPEINEHEIKTFFDQMDVLVKDYEVICMSGSWPKGASSDAYLRMIENTVQKKVFLDCSGKLLSNALNAHPYGIHINLQEGIDLFGLENPVDIVLKLSMYCEMAALTVGKDGLFLAAQGQLLHANVQIDHVISTVGSGDCLVAGLAVATAKRYNLQDTAKLAVACGAANCLCPDLGMLKRNDVEALLLKAIIKEL